MYRWKCKGGAALLGLILLATGAAATVTKMAVIRTVTLLTITTLNNNALTTAGPPAGENNYIGGGSGDGALSCEIEANVTFGGFPVEGSALAVFWARSIDDSNYATCGLGLPAATLPMSSTAFSTRAVVQTMCATGLYKACVLNDGTGQQITTGTIKVRYLTPEGL